MNKQSRGKASPISPQHTPMPGSPVIELGSRLNEVPAGSKKTVTCTLTNPSAKQNEEFQLSLSDGGEGRGQAALPGVGPSGSASKTIALHPPDNTLGLYEFVVGAKLGALGLTVHSPGVIRVPANGGWEVNVDVPVDGVKLGPLRRELHGTVTIVNRSNDLLCCELAWDNPHSDWAYYPTPGTDGDPCRRVCLPAWKDAHRSGLLGDVATASQSLSKPSSKCIPFSVRLKKHQWFGKMQEDRAKPNVRLIARRVDPASGQVRIEEVRAVTVEYLPWWSPFDLFQGVWDWLRPNWQRFVRVVLFLLVGFAALLLSWSFGLDIYYNILETLNPPQVVSAEFVDGQPDYPPGTTVELAFEQRNAAVLEVSGDLPAGAHIKETNQPFQKTRGRPVPFVEHPPEKGTIVFTVRDGKEDRKLTLFARCLRRNLWFWRTTKPAAYKKYETDLEFRVAKGTGPGTLPVTPKEPFKGLDEGEKWAHDHNIQVAKPAEASDKPKGELIRQEPPPGQPIPASGLTLVVSNGPTPPPPDGRPVIWLSSGATGSAAEYGKWAAEVLGSAQVSGGTAPATPPVLTLVGPGGQPPAAVSGPTIGIGRSGQLALKALDQQNRFGDSKLKEASKPRIVSVSPDSASLETLFGDESNVPPVFNNKNLLTVDVFHNLTQVYVVPRSNVDAPLQTETGEAVVAWADQFGFWGFESPSTFRPEVKDAMKQVFQALVRKVTGGNDGAAARSKGL